MLPEGPKVKVTKDPKDILGRFRTFLCQKIDIKLNHKSLTLVRWTQ